MTAALTKILLVEGDPVAMERGRRADAFAV